jgi:hypothetical protein
VDSGYVEQALILRRRGPARGPSGYGTRVHLSEKGIAPGRDGGPCLSKIDGGVGNPRPVGPNGGESNSSQQAESFETGELGQTVDAEGVENAKRVSRAIPVADRLPCWEALRRERSRKIKPAQPRFGERSVVPPRSTIA